MSHIHRYSSAEHDFLRNFIPGHTYKEIAAAYNATFEEPITVSRVKGYMANHKINNGLTGRFKKGHIPANKGKQVPTVGRMAETQYKKGNLPHNTKPIGYERVTRDGYIEVKIKMRPSSKNCNDNFKPKHHIVWEQHNGPIPKGYALVFLDGNKQNCNIDNLRLVSRAGLARMNQNNLFSTNPEITNAGAALAELKTAIGKRKRVNK